MSSKGLGGYLAFTMFVGAAWEDAFEYQRVMIRTQGRVHLEHMRAKDPAVGKAAMVAFLKDIQEIMGPKWKPSGEWAVVIENMLKGERDG